MTAKDAKGAPWDKTAEVFAKALEIPVSERQAWLAGLADLDEDVRREVASLLEANEKASGFLQPGRSHKLLPPGSAPPRRT